MKNIKVFQIADIGRTDYAFRGFSEKLFSRDDYTLKDARLYTERGDDSVILDSVFYDYNDCDFLGKINFVGHSMSVSDVVVLDDKAYYCESFGWKDISDHWFGGV
jgi:hypothetical protein